MGLLDTIFLPFLTTSQQRPITVASICTAGFRPAPYVLVLQRIVLSPPFLGTLKGHYRPQCGMNWPQFLGEHELIHRSLSRISLPASRANQYMSPR